METHVEGSVMHSRKDIHAWARVGGSKERQVIVYLGVWGVWEYENEVIYIWKLYNLNELGGGLFYIGRLLTESWFKKMMTIWKIAGSVMKSWTSKMIKNN